MVEEYISKSEEETLKIAEKFSKTLKQGDIVLLNGDLGAGKTVFVKGAVKTFSRDKINAISPTFLILNIYDTDPKIYHFDLYRLNKVDELYDIGAEEYLFGDGISFVEWPERASEIFFGNEINIYIEKIGDYERKIRIER